MAVICRCNICDGKYVHPDTARNHNRSALKNQTVLQQNARRRNLASSSVAIGESSTTVPIHPRNPQGLPSLPQIDRPCTSSASPDLGNGTLSSIDLDVITPHTSLRSDPSEPQFSPINNHLVDKDQEDVVCQENYDDQLDFPDEDDLPGVEDGDEVNININTTLHPSEPDPDADPFLVDQHPTRSIADVLAIPDHLIIIYTMVSWLHMQFQLPRIACNAVLAIFACLVKFLDPQLPSPFITLPSITRTLAVDPQIELLLVCPNCRDVFPSAASQHVQDACTSCNVPLFLPNNTK